MQQGIRASLAHPRSTTDDNHGTLLCKRASHWITDAEAADAIRHADGSNPIDTRVAIGRVSRTGFVRCTDDVDRALFKHPVELQHEVPGNPEHVANTVVLQSLNEIGADCLSQRNPTIGFLCSRTTRSVGPRGLLCHVKLLFQKLKRIPFRITRNSEAGGDFRVARFRLESFRRQMMSQTPHSSDKSTTDRFCELEKVQLPQWQELSGILIAWTRQCVSDRCP